jgi:hypothetical protein
MIPCYTNHIHTLLAENLLHNRLVQQYLTILEHVEPMLPIPVLSSNAVRYIVENHKNRGPLSYMQQNHMEGLLVLGSDPKGYTLGPIVWKV